MNLLQLVLKQMRQRALSTWLTLLSVVLGSTLAIGTLIMYRESGNLFVQTDFGYDVLVGVKASPMQLVLNTIYHVDQSPGNIPYVLYEGLRNNPASVKFAVPYVLGDTYKGHRVVGTLPTFFGFDEQGKPLRGYDERGHLLAGFERPGNEPPADLTRQVAAGTFEYRLGRRFTLGQGRVFHPRKFEAVIGSDIGQLTGLKIGDRFKVAHDAQGKKDAELDEHDEQWTVVGVLDRTGTAEDRVVYIPLISFYAIPQHEQSLESTFAAKSGLPAPAKKPASGPATNAAHPHDDHDDDDGDHDHDHGAHKPATTQAATKPHGHDEPDHDHHDAEGGAAGGHHHHDHEEAYELNADGTIDLKLARDKWQLSAILVKARSGFAAMSMMDAYKRGDIAMAVNPATVMREFFNTFLKPSTMVLMIVVLVVVVTAAVSIMVSIYNAVSARTREIAIMRALGATRGNILTMICAEAGLVGLIGGVVGIVLGHGLGAVISGYFTQKMGTEINWLSTSWHEWLYLGGVVVLSVLAGLVPGLKAYRTPVATNLVTV